MESLLLSIVIPTRNREKYCIEAIKDILSYNESCFELVVQDNSDSNQIGVFVQEHPDERLRYYRIEGRLNSVINIRTCLDYAEGEYVCMIGDDDTILPNIFSVVRWAKEKGIKAVCPSNNPAFFWNLDGFLKGKLITQPSNSQYKWARPDDRLKALLKGGIIDYQQYALPRVYHGLMHKEVLKKIKERTGHIIGGLSPDIYLTVSSCFYLDKYIITNFPISVFGACVQSTSVGNPRGKFEDMPHLWNRGEYNWDELIPRYNSSKTIWAESALKAIDENGKNEEYRHLFNQKYFMVAFRKSNNDRKKEIDELLGKHESYSFNNYLRYYVKCLGILCAAIRKRVTGGRKEYYDLESWCAVVEKLKDNIVYL